jgi:hypothetical protein
VFRKHKIASPCEMHLMRQAQRVWFGLGWGGVGWCVYVYVQILHGEQSRAATRTGAVQRARGE